MPERTFRRGFLARASLLLATLVFVLGRAIEPVVHASASAPTAVTLAWDVQPPSSNGETTHDETRCAVCHAFSSIALPAALTIVVAAPHPSQLPDSRPHLPPTARGFRSVNARGPPSA